MNEEISVLIDKIEATGEKTARDAAMVRAQAAIAGDLADAVGELSKQLSGPIGSLPFRLDELTGAFRAAAESSDRSAARMASLTTVLAWATVAYVILTAAGLLLPLFRSSPSSH